MMDHEQTHLLAGRRAFCSRRRTCGRHRSPRPGRKCRICTVCDPIEGIDPRGLRVTPTTYVDVTAVHPTKLRMLSCHASQRAWLRAHHGMDEYLDAVDRHDASRGAESGTSKAEAFVQHRGHAYPADDVVANLLSEPRP